jgi:SRSO17 transposase
MQRLLERADWDVFAAMRKAREFAVAGLGDPADAVLVIDESGQEKAGEHTAGVQRQYLGCAAGRQRDQRRLRQLRRPGRACRDRRPAVCSGQLGQ